MASLGDRLATRTLELVDIPSESRHEDRIREHVRALVPPEFAAETELEDAGALRAAAPCRHAVRRARRALRHRAGAGQRPGAHRRRRRARARGERHEGRARGRARAGRRASPRSSRPHSTSRCSSSGRRSCRRSGTRFRRCSPSPRLVHEADLAILLEPTDGAVHAGCVGNVNARSRVPRHERSLRTTVAGRQRDRARRGGPRFGHRASAARRGGRRAHVLRGAVGDAAHGGHRRQRDPRPRGRPPQLPLHARPGRGRGGRGARVARPGRRRPRRRRHCASRRAWPPPTASSRGSWPPEHAGSSRSRRGRTSPTSPSAAWTRSTSGPVTPASPTDATSWSRSTRSCTPTRRSGGSSPARTVAQPRGSLPPCRSRRSCGHRRRIRSCASTRRRPSGSPGASTSSTSAWATRASRPTRQSSRRSVTACASGWAIRRPPACPSCARRSPPGRARRFGVALDPDIQVIPTLGSKEAIFSFAQVVLDAAGGKDTVVVTEPGYPVPGRGAAFAGARVVELPLLEEHGFLPDLDAVRAGPAGSGRRSSGSTTRTTPPG